MEETGKVFIKTFGCQMNVYDSEKIMAYLDDRYIEAASEDEADLILLNTCSVRGKAEQKVFSMIGRFKPLKDLNPELIIAVGGCVAQQEGQGILDRSPLVDLVFGTHNIEDLPDLLDERIRKGKRVCRIIEESDKVTSAQAPSRAVVSKPARLVTIMKGCDNFCAYCIVPYVRGREISRPSVEIISEVESLVENGALEITLLGQNVNSYRDPESGDDFTDLLEKVDSIHGLSRLRFVTSHPKDFSVELINAMASLETVCEHIHLPLQAASDRVLGDMKRSYTLDEYRSKVAAVRDAIPDVELTSDIIVGFPGEKRSDFDKTMSFLSEIRYQNVFSFRFSPRPGTAASRLEDSVPERVKKGWLPELQHLQSEITARKHEDLLGNTLEVLVEGTGKKENGMLEGRTRNNFIVHFPGSEDMIGSLTNVKVNRSGKIHLESEVVK